MDDTESVRQASERFYAAANHVVRGDPAPMLAAWSHSADATYLDPRGAIQLGWEALRAYWEEAARLNAGSPGQITATAAELMIHVAGDLAYTVGTEHIQGAQADRTAHLEARATNIYRREAGAWKLIHRHAAPPRERTQADPASA